MQLIKLKKACRKNFPLSIQIDGKIEHFLPKFIAKSIF